MNKYVFSDIHGNYNLFKQIKNFLQEDDMVICLGDCCDRGLDGIKIMQEVLEDDRFIYIMGNHEAMFVDAIKTGTLNNHFSLKYLDSIDRQFLKENGTLPTIRNFLKLDDDDKDFLIERLSSLPVAATYINKQGKKIFLSHSGLDLSQSLTDKNKHLIYWERKHISQDSWDEINFPNVYMVHGHTPVQSLSFYNKKLKPTAYDVVKFYCDGHKIDIDLGTPSSNKIALFNLDTFRTIYFEDIIKIN